MMTLNSKASDEIIAILEKERWPPLDQDAVNTQDRLPTWAIVLLLIGMAAVFGGACALVVRVL